MTSRKNIFRIFAFCPYELKERLSVHRNQTWPLIAGNFNRNVNIVVSLITLKNALKNRRLEYSPVYIFSNVIFWYSVFPVFHLNEI